MLLAATGMRATEALSIRICDLDFKSDPSKLFIRGEYTKTKSDRTILLTQEVAQQLKYWLEYKYRTRRVSFYEKNTHKSISEYRTPLVKDICMFQFIPFMLNSRLLLVKHWNIWEEDKERNHLELNIGR